MDHIDHESATSILSNMLKYYSKECGDAKTPDLFEQLIDHHTICRPHHRRGDQLHRRGRQGRKGFGRQGRQERQGGKGFVGKSYKGGKDVAGKRYKCRKGFGGKGGKSGKGLPKGFATNDSVVGADDSDSAVHEAFKKGKSRGYEVG